MLSESVNSKTPSTLPELPIHFEGENDGSFDNNDYILFFAKSANVWEWNHSLKSFYHEKNLYTDTVFYWINIGTETGKRIEKVSEPTESSNKTFNTYENHQFHEIDNVNLIKSGRVWFGDYFDITTGLKRSFHLRISAKYLKKRYTSKLNSVLDH